MHTRKSILATTIAVTMSTTSLSSLAALTSGATLNFTLGTTTDPDCPLCPHAFSDIYGSYFAMDTNDNGVENNEKTPIGSFNGIVLGELQDANGSHHGSINGFENPNIDNPWTFFGGTGMHQTTSPVSATAGGSVDMSGWNMTWNGISSIPLTQQSASISCDSATCSDSSNFTIDGAFHVAGGGFTTVAYTLHLEGHISAIPVPSALWLFGCGLLGLASVARPSRKRQLTEAEE